MKTLLKLLFALSLLVVLNSCSDDDIAPPEDSLEGTWAAVEMKVDFQINSTMGDTTISSINKIEGSNLDYELIFAETTFTASGNYDITSTLSANGVDLPATTTSYTNEVNSGTFTDNDPTILVTAPFFRFELDGIDATEPGEIQSMQYVINDNDELIFTQNETVTMEDSGITSTVTVVSTSTWARQ